MLFTRRHIACREDPLGSSIVVTGIRCKCLVTSDMTVSPAHAVQSVLVLVLSVSCHGALRDTCVLPVYT